MTLIAGLHNLGAPILLGDLLITAQTNDPAARSFLPTSAAAASLPAKGFRVAGTRKKVHIVNPRLAVAWAGSQLAASILFKDLHDLKAPTSRNELERTLSRHTEFTRATSVHLIGWLVEGEPRCFRWNSEWPHELFVADSHIEGSGENLLRDVMNLDGHIADMGPGVERGDERASLIALAKCSKL